MSTDPRFLPARALAQSQRDPAKGIVAATPRCTEFRRYLLEALWFGRYASAVKYRPGLVTGQFRTIVADHKPRHENKLVFRYDDGT